MSILDDILRDKRAELARRRTEQSLESLRGRAERQPPPPDFLAALRSAPVGLIAEVKRRSPSAGAIREPFDPAAVARAYAAGRAQALSVLMDEKYFGGGEADFRAVRAAVALPLLYKEFIVDPWQVWHAAALGASAALLIAAALDDDALRARLADCRAARLTALVETHTAAELDRAAAAGADCIGINNRDLRTFRTDLDVTLRLAARAPRGALLISESGIRGPDDVARLRDAGVGAVLVGEHLLRQPDHAAAARALMSRVDGDLATA